MTSRTAAAYRELTLDESHAMLAEHTVGRLAFTLHDRVDIEPINYANDHAWIFGRTREGAKLTTLLAGGNAAAEPRAWNIQRRRSGATPPHRHIVFGIFIQEITGRTAHPADADASRHRPVIATTV
jgi:hypothetical protein